VRIVLQNKIDVVLVRERRGGWRPWPLEPRVGRPHTPKGMHTQQRGDLTGRHLELAIDKDALHLREVAMLSGKSNSAVV
jgi:hypothetical protein